MAMDRVRLYTALSCTHRWHAERLTENVNLNAHDQTSAITQPLVRYTSTSQCHIRPSTYSHMQCTLWRCFQHVQTPNRYATIFEKFFLNPSPPQKKIPFPCGESQPHRYLGPYNLPSQTASWSSLSFFHNSRSLLTGDRQTDRMNSRIVPLPFVTVQSNLLCCIRT